MINQKTPKKAIFGNWKSPHILFKHYRKAYLLTCSTNASTIFEFFFFIFIEKLNWLHNNTNNNNNNKNKKKKVQISPYRPLN